MHIEWHKKRIQRSMLSNMYTKVVITLAMIDCVHDNHFQYYSSHYYQGDQPICSKNLYAPIIGKQRGSWFPADSLVHMGHQKTNRIYIKMMLIHKKLKRKVCFALIPDQEDYLLSTHGAPVQPSSGCYTNSCRKVDQDIVARVNVRPGSEKAVRGGTKADTVPPEEGTETA
jgi:hypothetical protein